MTARCWCDGPIGPRYPGDSKGLGCQTDMFHMREPEDPNNQTTKTGEPTMSTRSITGIKTESGYVGVYVHFDGYDDARLPTLKAMINRDGAGKVGTTIMNEGNRGGWSSLDENQGGDQDRNEPERFGSIVGYGVAYRDEDIQKPLKYEDVKGDVFIEYAYFIDMETGDIIWFDHNEGDGEPKVELYAEFKTPTDAEVEVAAQ